MDPTAAASPLVLPGLRPPTLLDSHSHLLPWLSADALASRFTQKASLRAPPARVSASPGWLSWVALSITLPVRKAHPTPSLTSPGSAVPGTCTSLLLVLCRSSACSHTALTARHPRCVLEHLLSWNYGLNPVGCSPSWAIRGCHGLFCTWAPRAWPTSCPHSKPREGRQQVESNQLLFKDVARSCTHH